MMKMFLKTLKAKKDKTKEEQEMIKMISSSYDISDLSAHLSIFSLNQLILLILPAQAHPPKIIASYGVKSFFFINDFSKYQEELKYLFEVYTDKEIETLFILLQSNRKNP